MIKNIKVLLGGKEIECTIDELKALKKELNDLFPTTSVKKQLEDIFPHDPEPFKHNQEPYKVFYQYGPDMTGPIMGGPTFSSLQKQFNDLYLIRGIPPTSIPNKRYLPKSLRTTLSGL